MVLIKSVKFDKIEDKYFDLEANYYFDYVGKLRINALIPSNITKYFGLFCDGNTQRYTREYKTILNYSEIQIVEKGQNLGVFSFYF